jgi:hypothetical protein
MVGTSTALMYGLMYLNTYRLEDVWLSETRAYMAMLMGGMMLAVMLSFMLHMYRSRAVNAGLYALSAGLFATGLLLVRSQATIQDASWMRSMIPHHSIAVLTSERAAITDPRARKLAEEIVAAQEKEMAEMEWLISELEAGREAPAGYPTGAAEGPPEIVPLADALRRPVMAALDPAAMSPAQLAAAVPDPVCAFRFAEGKGAVLGVGRGGGAAMMLTGQLVRLDGPPPSPAGGRYAAGGAALTVLPVGGDRADLVFELDADPPLRAGYRGVWDCAA